MHIKGISGLIPNLPVFTFYLRLNITVVLD